jgi:hypothetical protein
MTSGSNLEKVSLLRSVGGFHGVRACSRVFGSLLLFLGPSTAVGRMVPGSVPREVA